MTIGVCCSAPILIYSTSEALKIGLYSTFLLMNSTQNLHRFTFHYYSASKKELHYKKETLVQVITRDSDYVPIITTPQLSDEDLQGEEENAVDLLKMAVQTR